MKLTRIAAVIAIALTMSNAFAAGMEDNPGNGQASATTARKWYEAGDLQRQSEQGKAELDRQGFPQYAQ